MPHERFFFDGELLPESRIDLSDIEKHHLIVMRVRPGDEVEIINGRGQLAEADLLEIGKKWASLKIKKVSEFLPSANRLILAQAFPRLQRLDLIIEKATELGATEIWLYPGERSEKNEVSTSGLERLRQITISASKQCGRYYLPSIRLLPSLENWKTTDIPLFFGEIGPHVESFDKCIQKQASCKGLIFAVGSEKGFSSREKELLLRLGGIGTTLNKNILRTETAAIAALAIASVFLET